MEHSGQGQQNKRTLKKKGNGNTKTTGDTMDKQKVGEKLHLGAERQSPGYTNKV